MTKKPRNKKYNGKKSVGVYARAVLRHKCVLKIVGMFEHGRGMMYDLATMRPQDAASHEAGLIENLSWKWYVECSVLCRDQNGTEYLRSDSYFFKEAYRQGDDALLDYLNETHQALLKEQNPLHVITAAWIAVPIATPYVDNPIDNAKLFKIYKQIGGYDYLAKWEQKPDDHDESTTRLLRQHFSQSA